MNDLCCCCCVVMKTLKTPRCGLEYSNNSYSGMCHCHAVSELGCNTWHLIGIRRSTSHRMLLFFLSKLRPSAFPLRDDYICVISAITCTCDLSRSLGMQVTPKALKWCATVSLSMEGSNGSIGALTEPEFVTLVSWCDQLVVAAKSWAWPAKAVEEIVWNTRLEHSWVWAMYWHVNCHYIWRFVDTNLLVFLTRERCTLVGR